MSVANTEGSKLKDFERESTQICASTLKILPGSLCCCIPLYILTDNRIEQILNNRSYGD